MRLKRIEAAIEEGLAADRSENLVLNPSVFRSPLDGNEFPSSIRPRSGEPWKKCTMACISTRSTRIPVVGISFTSRQLRLFKGEF